MNSINKVIKCIFDSKYRFIALAEHEYYNSLTDEEYIKRMFKARMGYYPDLSAPQTFNEKLQWLKLYDHNPIYIQMVDKIEAKKVASEVIGEQHIIPTLGVWDHFEDIDFNALPKEFVLKCSHDSGGIVICKDRDHLDYQMAKKKINKSLSYNFYWQGREWPYKNVKPRVLAETYISDSKTNEIKDYKFMCFNGVVKCCFVCSERFSADGLRVTFFDRDWNIMPFTRHYPKSEKELPKPNNYEQMIIMAEKMSKGIPFVRVDLYDANGTIYFGEYTFYPGSGYEEFEPDKWDEIMGQWLVLPEKNENQL